ncbi:hypothetical protein R1sor_001910 [Riccia sorocarpa]|uniref:Uncharacterized protein n=1 Tax=Riccia sorocarpa TaxID=122646 RepID=A0ABD3GY51_9MARC
MSCVGLRAISAGVPHGVSAPPTDDIPADDHALVQYSYPSRMIGGPLMMEAAQKVDRCLARLQSLQGTVSLPAPAASASVSSRMSPVYSRSKSCIGSPRSGREEKEPVIRIHDILRFSDDFTGKIPALKQEQKGKYLRRLSRSKTEVFDDKKDPRDPHDRLLLQENKKTTGFGIKTMNLASGEVRDSAFNRRDIGNLTRIALIPEGKESTIQMYILAAAASSTSVGAMPPR